MEAEKIYKYLPPGIIWLLSSLPTELQGQINEIRLRRNGVLTVSTSAKNIVIKSGGSAYICTDGDIDETLSYISRSSMYAFDNAVRNGYIPLENGGRAGICGDAVVKNGEIYSFGSINSVCLRVPRFIKKAAFELEEHYRQNGLCGTVVFSPPGLGKTTYLKSIASILSETLRVGIVDERYELSDGIYFMADIITGAAKSDGIELLTRTMSPQVIICDEISKSEAESAEAVLNGGIALIASCHASSVEQLMRKEYMKSMIKNGVFELAVGLCFDGTSHKSELIRL